MMVFKVSSLSSNYGDDEVFFFFFLKVKFSILEKIKRYISLTCVCTCGKLACEQACLHAARWASGTPFIGPSARR